MNGQKEIKVEVENGKVAFYMDDFWHSFSDEQKREFIKSLVWEKEVFDDFVEAIVNDKIVTSSFNYRTFDVRVRLLESLGELAKNHFRSLFHEMEQAKLDKERWEKSYWKLYHSVRQELAGSLPELEPHTNAHWASDQEVEVEMQKRFDRACPCCFLDEGCNKNCPCNHPAKSGICKRCCSYGNFEQRRAKAHEIVERELHRRDFIE